MPLPPYLTSGASSRAHHAFLAKLEGCRSDHEEQEVIRGEVERCRGVLGGSGVGMAKIAETLIILLHVTTVQHSSSPSSSSGTSVQCAGPSGTGSSARDDIDVDFAMVKALELAEGGKTIRERRIGYLFLQERLRAEDELGLMMINTVRKDLSSDTPSHILLALHSIVHMPSAQLAPAVTPLLTSKSLLRHQLPAIRQRTFQALIALHLPPNSSPSHEGFPLSMSKIIKLLGSEEDSSVLCILIRLLRKLIQAGLGVTKRDEAVFLVDRLVDISRVRLTRTEDEGGQAHLELMRVFKELVMRYPADADAVVKYLGDTLRTLQTTSSPNRSGLLLDICCTSAALPNVPDDLATLLSPQISSLLSSPTAQPPSRDLASPSTSTSASTSTPTSRPIGSALPRPNDHYLALRCLTILRPSVWDGKLDEEAMRVVMGGLESVDETIRRATLRLLRKISPELLHVTFDNYLSDLRTSSNLSLPLQLSVSSASGPSAVASLDPDTKLTAGRLETASRTLEVCEFRYTQESSNDTAGRATSQDELARNARSRGKAFAEALIEIVNALNEGVFSDTVVLPPGGSTGGQVWEGGMTRVLELLKDGSVDFARAFTSTMINADFSSSTLAVLRATVICSYAEFTNEEVQVCSDVLIGDLGSYGPSVQEIILVAVVMVLHRANDPQRREAVQDVRKIQEKAGRYIRKRCRQVVDLVLNDLLEEVITSSRSRSLPDILGAMLMVHARYRETIRDENEVESTMTSASPAPHSSNSVSKSRESTLRYDAYEPPRYGPSSSRSKGSRADSRRMNGIHENEAALRRVRSPVESEVSISPGEFALMDLNGG